MTTYTEADFDALSWHDCCIHGIALWTGNPSEGDWTNDLALDIDFIVDGLCGVDGLTRFCVAPATLRFRGVTDLRIQIDWGDTSFPGALHPASIAGIDRERVVGQKVYPGRPYYVWVIRLNWPEAGIIRFGAVGFTQELRAQPVESESQHLSSKQRGA